ncbi:MAG: Ig-like domain-containing protein, partial [Thermoplasmata archaeon]|nr:Ig-like domain-containing protein [Thermoplasmata archaeon]
RGHGTIVHESASGSSPNLFPFYGGSYDQVRFQALYYSENVGAEGVIQRISFNRSASQVGVYNNFKISMAHTDLALLTNTFANNYKGYLVEVFPIANVEINSSNGDSWIHFDLNDNFTYDSSHNLLIDIEWNGDNGISVGIDQTNPGTPDRRKYSLDGGGVGSAGDRLPVIKFVTDVVDNGVVDGGKGTVNRTLAPDDVSEMRCQMLYNHTLINETGIIDKIRFQPNQTIPDWVVVENLSIRMAHSQNDTLGTVFEAHRIDAWTQVFNKASYNFSTSGGPEWVEIDIDNLFQYNGNDNLLIDLRWKGGYGGSNWGVNLSAECVNPCRLMVDNYSATNGTPDSMLYNLQAIFLDSVNLTWSASSSDTNLFTAGVSGRTLQITPKADAFGDGTVTLTLHNSNGETVSQHISVTINPVNDPPLIAAIPDVTCVEDVPFVLNLTGDYGDIDDDIANLTLNTNSPFVVPDGNLLRFIYPEGWTEDNVTVTVKDDDGDENSTVVHVIITPVNDAPQLTGFVGTFTCDATIAKTYTVHPVDEETVTGQLMIYTSSTYANATNHAISFLYPKGIGSESVTIYLVDENIYGSRNNISYVLAVTINDHPEVTAHSPSGTGVVVTTTIEVTFDMTMNDTATENAFSLTYGTTDINGTFSWNAGHTTMTFTPAAHLTNGVYDVSVGTGARSGTGIAPLEAYSWNFTAALGNYDGDGDGMPDQYEIDNGLDPDTDDSTLDKDGDGMPNIWEYQNDLDPSVNDAGLDPDGDGFSNLDEYQAGTDPNDLNDKPYSFPMLLILLIIIIVIVVLLAAILLMRRGNRARGREAEQFDEDPYSGAEAGELEVGEPLEHQEGSPPPPPPTEDV